MISALRVASTTMDQELLEVKRRIKDWEKAFRAENGNVPTKADIKANNEIRKAYKTYHQLKEKLKTGQSKHGSRASENGPKGDSNTKALDPQKAAPNRSVSVSIGTDDEAESDHTRMSSANVELGPTPQANGRVLSIFDMMISPPESSPLKASAVVHSSPVKHMFKTPTKAVRKIEFSDLTPSRGDRNIMAKLREASGKSTDLENRPKSAVSTPTKTDEPNIAETPFYLGKINNKFSFRESAPCEDPLATPTKTAVANFQVSPSPLKPQRLMFGLGRSVSELFNDNKNITLDEFEAEKLEIEQNLKQTEQKDPETENEQNPPTRKRKVLTQKRTTRRWKIKPNASLEKEDAFEGKNIHEEIRKLDENDRKSMADYMSEKTEENEPESEDDDEIAEEPPAKVSRPKKPRPISNNFQRLKINDPRTKRFKQRMRR